MRYLNAALIFAATTLNTLAAQEPVPPTPPAPARAPRPGVMARPAAPEYAPEPARAPRPGYGFAAPAAAPAPFAAPAFGAQGFAPPVPAAPPVAAPAFAPPEPPELFIYQGQGRGSVIDREEARRIAELAREFARTDAERTRELAREQAREQAEIVREQAQVQREMAREFAYQGRPTPAIAPMPRINTNIGPQGLGMGAGIGGGMGHTLPENPPHAWAQNDPADSLYRAANDVMNKGDYRKAATLFKEIPVKFPYSVYAADAMYWQAHALYRVGGNQDLQEALQVLEQLKAKFPTTRLRNGQGDVAQLQVRIAGVLSSKGQGGSDIVKRALAQNTSVCDSEDASVRSAALNALMQTDPDAAMQYAFKLLGRKDECSRELRRNALFLIGERRGGNGAISAPALAALINTAKTDPSPDVRQTAVSFLGRNQSDEALAALEELMKSSDDQGVQREAIRALARNANPRARAGIKALVERNDVNENLRSTALDAFDQERATDEDIKWLQALYTKLDSPRLRSRVISAIARLGGSQNEKWFATLANNENESIEVRLEAVRRAGQTMDIPALNRLYDQTGQRQLRMEIVRQLGQRKEPETIDKLAEIAKNGTDPQVRTRAIEALTNKKDDRATKVLLSLVDRPEKED